MLRCEDSMITPEIIEEVVRRLVRTYDPLEIYLFGSYARGDQREDSDLDLLVVVESSQERSHARVRAGYAALRGLGIYKDLAVYTKDEFAERINEIATLPYYVNKEGKCLYARA